MTSPSQPVRTAAIFPPRFISRLLCDGDDPFYWGAVFPLGMYNVCTYRMAQAMDLDFIYFIPRSFPYISLLAWTAAFVGLLSSLTRSVFGKRTRTAE